MWWGNYLIGMGCYLQVMKYLHELLKISEAVRRQFAGASEVRKFTLEDIPYSGVDEELRHKELSPGLERLYPERVVLRVTNYCQQLCSFCYEAPRINKAPYNLSEKNIDTAVEIIEKDKRINYVLISGGTPFILGPVRLEKIISRLHKIEQIKHICIAGSRPIFNPALWSEDIATMLSSYNKPDYNNPNQSKNIGVSVHFNHPEELTTVPEGAEEGVVKALHRFTSKGINVYCYSTLLKGINNDADTLKNLFSILKQNNIRPYYLVHPLNTPWNTDYRVSVQEMVDLAGEIEPLSGQVKPLFIVATPIGKVALHSSMKLEYKEIGGIRHVRFKTPYKLEEFLDSNRLMSLPPKVEIDSDKRLIVYYPDAN